ncbi:MAG: hypothetical protein WBA74_25505, partial [Cyclobacteriaceae bacterium]
RRGPQTERTGYRSGSKLRAQIYDKTAERSGSGEKVVKDLTRFEFAVSKPQIQVSPLFEGRLGVGGGFQQGVTTDAERAVTLGDLEHLEYPAPAITMRACAYSPLKVANHVYGSLAAYARGLGIRAATGYAREVFNLTYSQRLQWLDTLLPELDHSPRKVWSSAWPSAARRTVEALQSALHAAKPRRSAEPQRVPC